MYVLVQVVSYVYNEKTYHVSFISTLKICVIFLLLQQRDYRDNVNMRFPSMWATLDHSEAEYKM